MKKLLIALLTLMLGTTPALAAEIPGLVWESSMEKTYATEFNVDYFEGGYALIEVIDSASYLVVPEGMPVPESLDGSIRVLRQPLDRIYLQATSGMALIDRLDALDSIRLVGTRQNGWYVDNAVQAMEDGKILFSGSYSEPDYELMINEGCDLAIESTMILHTPKVQEMIELLGIPVFIEHASYPDSRRENEMVYDDDSEHSVQRKIQGGRASSENLLHRLSDKKDESK